MRLKTIIVAVAAAALLPTAAFADPTPAPSDKANGARTCAALKTSMGATFATTYGTNADKSNAMGKCVSAWTRAEHQNRHEAATACKAEQPDAKGAALQRCIQAKLKAERTAERAATIKAAKTCKAERSSLGAAAFTAKYGTKANAFGKCVSQLAQAQQD